MCEKIVIHGRSNLIGRGIGTSCLGRRGAFKLSFVSVVDPLITAAVFPKIAKNIVGHGKVILDII